MVFNSCGQVLLLTEKLLLKERNGGSDPFELIKRPETESTILDSGSLPYADDEDGYYMPMELTGSANALKLSNFDRSQIGEVDDASDYSFLGLEDNSCGYGLLWS